MLCDSILHDTVKKQEVQRRKQISGLQRVGLGGEVICRGGTLVLWGDDEVVV